MAERQAAAKKRRQRTIAISAAVGLLLVAGGVVWVVAAVTGDDTPPLADATPGATPLAPVEAGACSWLPEDPSAPGYENLDDVGTPPAVEPGEGVSTMTLETNLGAIEVEMDVARVPCTAASFAYLASLQYYDGSVCHRLTTADAGIFVLQCGDPTATGGGGPTYKFAEENLPVDQSPAYPKGVIAMAKRDEPASTGSQFFIVYEDTDLPPNFTVLGTVTEGMDIVEEVAAAGATDPTTGEATADGTPNQEVVIETLTVSDPAPVDPA
jgi:peptidyl-prolyl cis-trans isomerase B (cyclophilin B)